MLYRIPLRPKMTTLGRRSSRRTYRAERQGRRADNGRGEPGDFDQGYTSVVFAPHVGDLVRRYAEESDDQGFRMSFPAIGDFGL